MTLDDFRARALSDKIVKALIEATEAYVTMDVLVNEHLTIRPALSDILLSLDSYYSLLDIQPDICHICHSLYVPIQTDTITRTIRTIVASIGYAQDRLETIGVLTAGDLLRIDDAVNNTSVELLTACCYSSNQESKIGIVWSILHDLYGPKRQHTLIMETAVACYRFLTLSSDCSLNLQTLIILFSALFRNNLAFQGLQRQWILSTDPQLNLCSIDIEDALTHILEVFKVMWKYTTVFIRRLNDKQNEISQFIIKRLPVQTSEGFHKLLAGNLCLRNQYVSEILHISPKTAIKHLKMFEQENALYSIKTGREIFYFNNMLLDLLKQTTEVYLNGSEKP